MRRRFWGLALFALAASAGARTPDGSLAMIRTPNSGVPAITRPGSEFKATLAHRAELRLISADGGRHALAAEWTDRPGLSAAAVCRVPDGLPEGPYALESEAAGEIDRNAGAVWISAAATQAYVVVHAAQPRLGTEGAEAALTRVLAEAAKAKAAFAVLTGNLTADNTPEQIQGLIALLDASPLPVYTCPGPADAQHSRYFGPDTYSFTYGDDGYIVYRSQAGTAHPDALAQPAQLQVFRRAIKPCRWSIGITDRYEPGAAMREELVLFIDDPLHALITGADAMPEPPGLAIPWSKTDLIVTPPLLPTGARPVIVSAAGVKAAPPKP